MPLWLALGGIVGDLAYFRYGDISMTKKTQPAASLKLLVGAATIDKAISSIKLRSTKITQDIQVAALSILSHVEEHGDVTLADRLYCALGVGQRRASLAMWLVAFGKMRVLDKANNDDAAALKAGRVFGYDKARVTNMAAAEAKQWHEMQKEPDVAKVFDVQAAFANLMARITKAQKDGLTIENAELIEKLTAVM